MKKLLFTVGFLILAVVADFASAGALGDSHVEAICKKENPTCADLYYTKTTSEKNSYMDANQGWVCSECPLSPDRWACVQRGISYAAEVVDDIPDITGNIPTCGKFPSCAEMGYKLTAASVGKIRADRNCSACPFDGRRWACVGPSGVLKVN